MADTSRRPQLTDQLEPKGVCRRTQDVSLSRGRCPTHLATVIKLQKEGPRSLRRLRGAPPQPYIQDKHRDQRGALQRQLGADKLKAEQDAQLAAATGSPAAPRGAAGRRSRVCPNGQQKAHRRTGSPSSHRRNKPDSSLLRRRRRGQMRRGFRPISPLPEGRRRLLQSRCTAAAIGGGAEPMLLLYRRGSLPL